MALEPAVEQLGNFLRMCQIRATELKYDVAQVLRRKLADKVALIFSEKFLK